MDRVTTVYLCVCEWLSSDVVNLKACVELEHLDELTEQTAYNITLSLLLFVCLSVCHSPASL